MMYLDDRIIKIRKNMNLPREKFVKLLLDHMEATEQELMFDWGGGVLFTIKIFNLLLEQYEYRHGFQKLLSRPFFTELDPANACQLRCPGCVHSPTLKSVVDWDSTVMNYEVFKDFMDYYGAYSLGMYFYNYGEPFINQSIYKMIKYARGFGVSIAISSNLSLPIDAQALVESGLDTLICSIDGATQETYEKYRRGGNLQKIEENMRAIAAEKQRTGKTAPNIVWQFLTFEHNIHELDRARELAEKWGANQFVVGNPFSVQLDDPTIIELSTDRAGWYSLSSFDWNGFVKNGESTWDHLNLLEIEREYASFKQRLKQFSADEFRQPKSTKYCDWHYKALVIDANGQVLPCCYMHTISDKGRQVLGKWMHNVDVGGLYNSAEYQDMRMNEKRLKQCASCGGKEHLIFDTFHIKRDFQCWSVYRDLSEEAVEALCDWTSDL